MTTNKNNFTYLFRAKPWSFDFTHLQAWKKNIRFLQELIEYQSFSKKKCLGILSVIFHRQFRFFINGIFLTCNGHAVFSCLFFKVLLLLQKWTKNRDRQITASNLNWRLSFLKRFSNKERRNTQRSAYLNYINHEKIFCIKFNCNISKNAKKTKNNNNKNNRNSRNAKGNNSFCSQESFEFFIGSCTKILINLSLIKKHLYFVI